MSGQAVKGRVMLIYPPGKMYQRSEDRAQCNIEDSAVATVHACNDLGYAASVLRNGGFEVFLRDYQTERKSAADAIDDLVGFKPDMLFMSITNATVHDDLKFIKELKKHGDFITVLKGAIFFDTKEDLLSYLDLSQTDYLIGGEEEFVIEDIANFAICKKGDIKSVKGIFYKNEKGEFEKTDFACWQDDLDSLPFPARDLMNNALYTRPDTGEPMATISVARGCPSACTYCLTPIISGRKVRKRSIENVFLEIEECYKKYGIRNFFFKADTFTLDNKWAIELCDRIINSDLNKKIEFTVNSRADTVSEELLKKLKEAGCFMFAIGFESGNEETLKRIKKGTTVSDNLNAAELVKKAGLPLLGFFMVGFPWETEEDIKKTLNFIFKVDPDFIEIHIAMPYYGTELYNECVKYKTITDAAFGFDYYSPNTKGTESVSIERVTKLKKRYNLKFYLRPKYILRKTVQTVNNPKVLVSYAKHGIKLLNKNIF